MPQEHERQQASAPQIMDLDRDVQTVRLTPLSSPSIGDLSLFLLPDVPLVNQKRASRRTQHPSTDFPLNSITTSSSSSPQSLASSTPFEHHRSGSSSTSSSIIFMVWFGLFKGKIDNSG